METTTLLDLSSLADLILEGGTKGLPPDVDSIRLGDVSAAGWRLHHDLQLPAAVLRRSAIDGNAAWMKHFQATFGVELCPHGKTTMAPQMFDRQLRDGAWGLTCATFDHLRTYRRYGVRRIIFANQIATLAAAHWIVREMTRDPDFEILIFVDSVEGADLLANAARLGSSRPIQVLLEVGVPGARTGVRSFDDAIALARHVAALGDELELAGLSTFEGVVPGASDVNMEPHVNALFDEMHAIASAMAAQALFRSEGPVVLTAGGSRFFDITALRLKALDLGGRKSVVVLRSGCYVTMDATHYDQAFKRLLKRDGAAAAIPGGLQNALEVWSHVQSRPEPTRLYANLGKRDISHDLDAPRPLSWLRPGVHAAPVAAPAGIEVASMTDQHAHLRTAEDCELAFGDQLSFGASHPCTTFDKWRVLFVVEDDGTVTDAIATCF